MVRDIVRWGMCVGGLCGEQASNGKQSNKHQRASSLHRPHTAKVNVPLTEYGHASTWLLRWNQLDIFTTIRVWLEGAQLLLFRLLLRGVQRYCLCSSHVVHADALYFQAEPILGNDGPLEVKHERLVIRQCTKGTFLRMTVYLLYTTLVLGLLTRCQAILPANNHGLIGAQEPLALPAG